MSEEELKQALKDEAARIEEDALHSSKGHFNAAANWRRWRLIIGIPAVALAAWAGVQAVTSCPWLTAFLAMSSGALSAVATLLDPEKRATEHQAAGRELNALKNIARKFREIEINRFSIDKASERLEEIFERRDNLNRMSPDIPDRCYEKAKKDIDEGRSIYRVDGDKQ